MIDRTLNPFSDFLRGKDGKPVSQALAMVLKTDAFYKDVNKEKAFTAGGRRITLGKFGAHEENVDLVSGVWRVQKKFPYKITRIRDKDMVLTGKLSRKESTLFDFYTAKAVSYNCYGPFITMDSKYDYIVAKYETDNGPLWGYGKTLEAARAYLGIKLYDEYKDVIHRIACRSKIRTNK